MGRAPCCDRASVKRGAWLPEEDEVLRSFVEKHGSGGNWIALPLKAGLNRCGKSCRLRWLNYLRPDIKHGGFTEEEDNIIFSLYSKLGSRWSIIASHLRGRTDNDVKNYWNTKLKKKLIVSNYNTTATMDPSATPPPALLSAAAIKSESSSQTTDSISKLYSPPFSSNYLSSMVNDQEGSVSSSTITADDGSGSSSRRNRNWPAGEEDTLLSEFDLGLLSELLGDYGSEEMLGGGATSSSLDCFRAHAFSVTP